MTAQSDQESSETVPAKGASDATTRLVQPHVEQGELRPGDILRERYVIERLLGEGGMGKVFLAVDREAEQDNPHVALKMLGEGFKNHPQSLKALRREASQSQRMSHPNIVNVFYFERTPEHVFMVMEFMRGHSLDVFLERNPQGSKLATVWAIIEACAEGLKYIHEQRIIHSDFKPGNVFVTEEGDIKVLDLGIARTVDEAHAADGTTRFDPDALGALTPTYASCEMLEGLTPTVQDDLFAFACVIYELLTGQHPYQRQSAVEARAALLEPHRPHGLKQRQWRVLKSALAFARGDRPVDIAAFLTDFAPKRSGDTRTPWIAAITAGVVLVAALVVFLVLQSTNTDDRFIQATLAQYGASPDPVSLERAQDWLDQGDFFLNFGSKSLMNSQYETGTSQLLTAPSSAYQSYRLVLSRSDDLAARQKAAEGMLNIANGFKDAAIMLSEKNEIDMEMVAKTVCRGLEVNQYDEILRDLYVQVDQQMTARASSLSECRQLVSSGKLAL